MSKEKMTKVVLTEDGKVLMKRPNKTFAQIEGKTDWAKLAAIKEEDTDYSEVPELTEAFWEEAKASMSEAKKPVFLRLDGDVLQWFRGQGRGYQTRINAILRAYMKTHDHKANHTP
jgi:uncharacterized protein (DUF4415 family)